MGLLSDAKILLIDNPLEGLDSETKRKLIIKIKENGKRSERIIILSTTLFEEALQVSTDILLFKNERIYEVHSPKSLREKYCYSYKIRVTAKEEFYRDHIDQ